MLRATVPLLAALLVSTACFAGNVPQSEWSPTVKRLVQKKFKASCKVFVPDDDFVTRHDLTGSGEEGYVIHGGRMSCDGSRMSYSGSAGSLTYFVVGKAVTHDYVDQLEIVPGNPPAIVINGDVDCGARYKDRCSRTRYWNGREIELSDIDKMKANALAQKHGEKIPFPTTSNYAYQPVLNGPETGKVEFVTPGDDAAHFYHNGSLMRADPVKGVIVYAEPKAAIANAVKPNQVLFRGRIATHGPMTGIAYVFKEGCAPAPYRVTGTAHNDRMVLTGEAPVRDTNSCAIVGKTRTGGNATLVFTNAMSP